MRTFTRSFFTMTCVSKVNMRTRVATVVAATVVMVAVVASARPMKLDKKASSTCETEDTYVYPYVSSCDSPAELSTGYYYILPYVPGGRLEPEYDEANSTYYVRVADRSSRKGATYMAVAANSTSDAAMNVGSTYYLINYDSKRALQWREEGTDEYFLIEKSVDSYTDGATFTFVAADDVSLACPLIYPPLICKAYYVMSTPSSYDSSAGWKIYQEDNAIYIKAAAAGSYGDAPMTVQVSSSTGSATMPFSTIRTVTQ